MPQITACENCVELVAEFAGPIMGEDCMEADTAACNAFVNHCECSGCAAETVALGECSVDFERSASGSDCPVFSCATSPTVTPGTPTMAPTNSGGKVGTMLAGALAMITMALLA